MNPVVEGLFRPQLLRIVTTIHLEEKFPRMNYNDPMYLLLPGRHHVLTNFTFQYLFQIIHTQHQSQALEGVIFAVTSANHSGTRRNPLSYAHRAMMIQDFARDLGTAVYVFPVEDAGERADFSTYTVKTVNHRAQGIFSLSQANTLVACSTAVGELYKNDGYTVLGAENDSPENPWAIQPWSLVEAIAEDPTWNKNPWILDKIHPSSYSFYLKYRLGDLIRFLFSDPLIGVDGDLTGTRDYGSYVRQMDENADSKWKDVASWVQPGRVGDIGCAVGSWLWNASLDPRLADSDFYGIEIARALFQICQQRKENGEFGSPNIWFTQRNAVTGLVFQEGSMNTIHTGSLTHEIESYGSHEDLLKFIANRYRELAAGGVWINRDVIGPEDRDRMVWLWAEDTSGSSLLKNPWQEGQKPEKDWLNSLSTRGLFYQFARDFRASEGYKLSFTEAHFQGDVWFHLRLEDAAEFLLTKDYTDNWLSEMHERFCFWSVKDWTTALRDAGFRVRPESRVFTNPWIQTHRFEGKVRLVEMGSDGGLGSEAEWPPTNMILIAEK